MSTNGNNVYGKERQSNWNVQKELTRFEMEYKAQNSKNEMKENRGKLFLAYIPFVIFTVCMVALLIICITNWDTFGEPSTIYLMLGIAGIVSIGVIINTISIIYFIIDASQNAKFGTGKKILWVLLLCGLNWLIFPIYFHKHVLYKDLEFEKENFRRTLEGEEVLEAPIPENTTETGTTGSAYYSRTPVKRVVVKEEKISVADIHDNMYDGLNKEYVSEQVKKYRDILITCIKSVNTKKGIAVLQEHENTVAFKDVLLLDEFRVRFRYELDSLSRCNRKILEYMISMVRRLDEEMPGTKEIAALLVIFETEREFQISKTLKHIKIMSFSSMIFSFLTAVPDEVTYFVRAFPPLVASILFLVNKRPIWGAVCVVYYYINRNDYPNPTLLGELLVLAVTLYFAYVTFLSFLDRKATKGRD